jgi:hypothetical protein
MTNGLHIRLIQEAQRMDVLMEEDMKDIGLV